MKPKFAILIVCFLAALLSVAPADAQTLYGSAKDQNFYTIDPLTGASTLVGPLNIPDIDANGDGTSLSELAADPTTGIIYATTGGGGCCPTPVSGCLYTINTATGAGTLVGCDPGMVGNDNYSAISFDSSGNLYGVWLEDNWGLADGNLHFGSVNKTNGHLTHIGSSPIGWNQGSALAFAPDGKLYYFDSADGLSTINKVTGVQTIIGSSFTGFPSGNKVPDMAYNSSGVLYATVAAGNGNPSHLGTVNTATGEVTYVATISGPDNMNVIEFAVSSPSGVPAVSLWGAAVLAAVMLTLAVVLMRRKARRKETPEA